MAAGSYSFIIEQGSEFRKHLRWENQDGTPIDLTGWSAKSQIRASKDKEASLIWTLSTDNGGIEFGDAGEIDLYIPASVTEEFCFTQAFYDLEMIPSDPNNKRRLLEGTVTLSKETTRDDES